ncbi:MAG: tryptophan synthase subunit alpha [Rhodospirillales bacterium]|jgi:tryptophan synthase alpha chain|nr:tryptophan synthase subunit alpha [Rhodospirillales bacterium]MBT4005847.1 tryptophan synthase subunit alpha [Rhodospirillales bacterium]MBT5075586.1 tryptophan synthase subunit alpha [Rhodospirillales bacterium]MBT5114132.1 tryptophan synthase subunit alpha [Rhodospirillales bacterium]MBT5672660.1 tryptophan synthase subunit alpha [Rhodospirillales bacterium]
MKDRIGQRFKALAEEGRAGLVTFITAGDPDMETSNALLSGLSEAGADLIELGMPFSDPMADGPEIQAASLRALKAGHNMIKTLEMVRTFRKSDDETPIILMGYYNPIYIYGNDRFLTDALAAGVDGLIIVDLPPEEDEELCLPSLKANMHFIRLATPTTDEKRMTQVLKNTSGFIYYVSITGITGTRMANADDACARVEQLRTATDLPIAIGFGIKTPEQAAAMARIADATVVGSAVVTCIREGLDDEGSAKPELIDNTHAFVSKLADGVRNARDKQK